MPQGMVRLDMPRPTHDPAVEACFAIASRCAAGEISAQVAVMEMLLATEDVAVLECVLSSPELPVAPHQAAKLSQLVSDNRAGLSQIASSLRVQANHPPPSA
jgi:hypothetical protein